MLGKGSKGRDVIPEGLLMTMIDNDMKMLMIFQIFRPPLQLPLNPHFFLEVVRARVRGGGETS